MFIIIEHSYAKVETVEPEEPKGDINKPSSHVEAEPAIGAQTLPEAQASVDAQAPNDAEQTCHEAMPSDDEDNTSEDVTSNDEQKTKNRRQRRHNAKLIRNCQKKVKRMNLKICDLTKKLQNMTKKREMNAVEDIVNFAKKYIPEPTLSIFRTQLRVGAKGKKGRRWTIKDKSIAVGLYHASPKGYALLRKLIALPSVSIIHRWLSVVDIQPGFSKSVKEALRKKVRTMSERDRYCSVVFDEMSVKEALSYDEKHDLVVGLQDLGMLGRAGGVAKQALVVMVRGLAAQWKQPLGYFLSCDGVRGCDLRSLLEECLNDLIEIGLHPATLVCDQGPNNRALFANLSIDKDNTFFEYQDHTIFCLYDIPHLLKSTRNNLQKYDIQFDDDKLAKWDHIYSFFETDQKLTLRYGHKLTKHHFELTSFSKMKVCYAAQVLSRTVAAGIYTHCSLGKMPGEAVHTAEFVERIDSLFDSLNSRSSHAKRDLRKPVSEDSCHIPFWTETLKWLEKVKVQTNYKVWFLDGWKVTLSSVIQLWGYLKEKAGFKYLFVSRCNQDCIENLFAQIRARGGDRDNPTSIHFQSALKSLMVDQMMKPAAGQTCLPDSENCLLNINDFAYAEPDHHGNWTMVSRGSSCSHALSACISQTEVDMNILTYVGGYIVRKTLDKHSCLPCRTNIESGKNFLEDPNHLFVHFKAWNITDCDFGKLYVPTDDFVNMLFQIEHDFVKSMNESFCGKNVKETIIEFIQTNGSIDRYRALFCSEETLSSVIELYVRMRIHYALKFKNRDLCNKNDKNDKNGKHFRKLKKVSHK